MYTSCCNLVEQRLLKACLSPLELALNHGKCSYTCKAKLLGLHLETL